MCQLLGFWKRAGWEILPSELIEAPESRKSSEPIWMGKTFSCGRMFGMSEFTDRGFDIRSPWSTVSRPFGLAILGWSWEVQGLRVHVIPRKQRIGASSGSTFIFGERLKILGLWGIASAFHVVICCMSQKHKSGCLGVETLVGLMLRRG